MVPKSLRVWFVIHFIADYLVAIPLLIAPVFILESLGWKCVDPVATRLVAAALFGVGGSSLIERNATKEVFRDLLNLKIIWASTASLGIFISLLQGAAPMAWLVFAIFFSFLFVWIYYRVRLKK